MIAACALFGVATGFRFPYAFASLAGGLAGVAGLARMKERRDVLLTGAWLALVNCATFLATGLVLDPETTVGHPSQLAGAAL